MKARFTKWGPIVYSAVADDGTLRMALHPVLDAEFQGCGGKLPCRVVWCDADHRALTRWSTSCRGLDSRSSMDGPELIGGGGPIDPCPQSPSPWFHDSNEDVDGNAIKWLIDGERRGTREQRRRTKARG